MDASEAIGNREKIGIFGNGVTGKATAAFCGERGIPCKIFDKNGPLDWQFTEKCAEECKLIVRSPSFMVSHEWVALASQMGCLCVTERDLAASCWRGKIVAITGTNGKTTTATFLEHALRSLGLKAVACGNIGKTFIEMVNSDTNAEDGWAAVEVSSFQMDGSKIFRPDYVLWTNFANDHIDAHGSPREYFNCKANLIRNVKVFAEAKSRCFVGQTVHNYCVEFAVDDVLNEYEICTDCGALPQNSPLNIRTQRENFALVQKFWERSNFPMASLQESALAFKIPPHRLQIVAKIQKNGKCVEFWNDSKATNFHALNAALASFDKKVILIAGGKSKDEPIEDFFAIVEGRVKAVLLMGETGATLSEMLPASPKVGRSVICKFFPFDGNAEKTMDAAVFCAFSLASDGDVVLLSPGFSSLDFFKDYAERGKFFENSVLLLKSDEK
jgi:UDP-N-acetylmuramoylalanine--D-glutamate ligase